MRSVLGPIAAVMVAFGCFAASCSADSSDPEASPNTTVGPALEPPSSTASDESGSEDDAPPLAYEFEVLSVAPAKRSIPTAAVEERVMVAVGTSVNDPRFIELTLFEFDESAEATAAAAFVGSASSVESTDLASGASFAFLPTVRSVGGVDRRDLQLLGRGPAPDSVVRGGPGELDLVVGAARVLQPSDVDLLVAAFRDGPSKESQPLPVDGMSILIDEALGEGIVVELDSADGPIQVEMYDDTDPSWFDYAARDTLAIGVNPPDLGLGPQVALQPPSSFGVNGTPLGHKELFWWDAGRLTTISYPPAMADESIAEVAATTRLWDLEELLATGPRSSADGSGDSDDSGSIASPQTDQTPSEPPSPETMEELQGFVEKARDAQTGQPVDFEFVDRIPTENIRGFFVSAKLWLVAEALDLVEDGQDQTSADLARVERVRGMPGTVVLQPTEFETNMIVVHEIAHIVDDRLSLGSSTSRELVVPAQALLEGNAHRVAYAYVESLAPAQRQQIPVFPGIFPDGDPRLSAAVQDIIEFPYDEGRLFATAIAAAGGEGAIDTAFQRPPTSSEHILFPDSYFADDQPIDVELPAIPSDAEIVDTGVLGAYLLSLAAREATGQGIETVAGWAGDSYVVYRREGQTCLTASVRMDTQAAAQDLAAGLGGGQRSVFVAGDVIDFTSCPGDLTE
ncbi:MAG: hypothetical protein ACRBK7_10895 [Acidimicrobiales bacterium]